MLFQSQTFLLAFLPALLAAWYAAAQWIALREWVLIVGSLVFYGWWDPRFVPLLIGQILVSWLIAELYLATGRRARFLLWVGIGANLGVLIFFKYWAFLAANLAAAAGLNVPTMSVVLPIGISFFTFEIISYFADLGWKGAPHYPLRRFALFVALFPRLIAGPIVRHHEIIPQFDLDPLRAGLAERFGKGATLLVIGLTKKVFLADALAPIAEFGVRAGGLAPGWHCGGVERRACVHLPALSRFLRVLGDGDRNCADARLHAAAEFRCAVPGDKRSRLLAPVAHDTFALSQGLRLYPARR